MPSTLLNNSNKRRSTTKLHGETFCFIPGSGIYAEKWYLKNGMSHIGLYGSAPPPPQVLFLLSRQKYVRTANAGRTALWNESNSNKWKVKKHGFLLSGSFPHKVFVSVTVIALPISLCCQSLIGIPSTYIQYNPANSHPLGEYKFKVKVNRVLS